MLLFGMTAYAEEEPEQLYARSAVLMDADTGRVLFEKNGYEKRAMASTTKIMTCILALEKGNVEDVLTASSNAARQPKVHLGVREGEQFRMEDLLYSMMLESHNDSAVMIAEHIGGSVEEFAGMMNEKAEELGCKDTHFVTPNGLDGVDAEGRHETTAADLARIMSYCVGESEQKNAFLQITGARQHTFTDMEQKRNISCSNHNAFLTMMEGAFSGKTGFTGEAGYCYVGALRRDDRTFVVALLGCGWPNNKTYKWSDTKKLMQYGLDHYTYRSVDPRQKFMPIPVKDGIPEDESIGRPATVPLKLAYESSVTQSVLAKAEERIEIKCTTEPELEAPVREGQQVGEVQTYLEGELLARYPVVAAKEVKKISIAWCIQKVADMYTL